MFLSKMERKAQESSWALHPAACPPWAANHRGQDRRSDWSRCQDSAASSGEEEEVAVLGTASWRRALHGRL